jgi:hypothetical protein
MWFSSIKLIWTQPVRFKAQKYLTTVSSLKAATTQVSEHAASPTTRSKEEAFGHG